ncbi:hypothetical protein B0T24DRAFT_710414 [Lasiosphaeria ovina]|uniref:Uncharacterized protein n=1 Tax=Lasiosphaeria ovina TaxID=92902 RepID=A0AAE0JZV7_9PEZI|nr:hypothetical protein B0T24DRAFT_710414 [Lasiosphaeria ovina]
MMWLWNKFAGQRCSVLGFEFVHPGYPGRVRYSRRVAHFTRGQIFWQCRSLLESEDQVLSCASEVEFFRLRKVNERGPSAEPWRRAGREERSLAELPLPSFLALRGPSHHGAVWWHWMRDHWSRKLTFPADFFPSLVGSLSPYQRLTGDEPALSPVLELDGHWCGEPGAKNL